MLIKIFIKRYMWILIYLDVINLNLFLLLGLVFCFVGEKGRVVCIFDVVFFFVEFGDFVLEWVVNFIIEF